MAFVILSITAVDFLEGTGKGRKAGRARCPDGVQVQMEVRCRELTGLSRSIMIGSKDDIG